jgi:hypothetical protein
MKLTSSSQERKTSILPFQALQGVLQILEA